MNIVEVAELQQYLQYKQWSFAVNSSFRTYFSEKLKIVSWPPKKVCLKESISYCFLKYFMQKNIDTKKDSG